MNQTLSLCNYHFNLVSRALLEAWDFENVQEISISAASKKITILPVKGKPVVIHIIGQEASVSSVVDQDDAVSRYGCQAFFALWLNDFDDPEDGIALAKAIHGEGILSVVIVEDPEGHIHCLIDPSTAEKLQGSGYNIEEYEEF